MDTTLRNQTQQTLTEHENATIVCEADTETKSSGEKTSFLGKVLNLFGLNGSKAKPEERSCTKDVNNMAKGSARLTNPNDQTTSDLKIIKDTSV